MSDRRRLEENPPAASARVRGSSLNKTVVVNFKEMQSKYVRDVDQITRRQQEMAKRMHLQFKSIQEEVRHIYEQFFQQQRQVTLDKINSYKTQLQTSEKSNKELRDKNTTLEAQLQTSQLQHNQEKENNLRLFMQQLKEQEASYQQETSSLKQTHTAETKQLRDRLKAALEKDRNLTTQVKQLTEALSAAKQEKQTILREKCAAVLLKDLTADVQRANFIETLETEKSRVARLMDEVKQLRGRVPAQLNLSFGKSGRPVINKSMIKSIVRESANSSRSASSNARSSVQSLERGSASPYSNIMQSPTDAPSGAFQVPPRKLVSIQKFRMGPVDKDIGDMSGVNQSMFQPHVDASMATNLEEHLNRSADLAQLAEYKKQLEEAQERQKQLREELEHTEKRMQAKHIGQMQKMFNKYSLSIKESKEKRKALELEKSHLEREVRARVGELRDAHRENERLEKQIEQVKQQMKEAMEEMVARHTWVNERYEWMKAKEEESRSVAEESRRVKLEIQEYRLKYQEEMLKVKKLHNDMQELKGNIRVYCRVRPMTTRDLARKDHSAVSILDDCELKIHHNNGQQNYIFDRCFHPTASQADIFEEIKGVSQSALDGFNVCVFAYGQTGAGKTFTLQGNHTEVAQHSEWGLVPRSIEHFFSLLQAKQAELWKGREPVYEIHVECYMVEIYKNFLYDLLINPALSKRRQRLDIIEDVTGCTFVHGATIYEVEDAPSAFDLYRQGIDTRKTGSHDMNYQSSRSHMIYSLVVRVHNRKTDQRTVSKLSFVDLAGSEKFDKTKTTNTKIMTEMRDINRSLCSLNRVFQALKDAGKSGKLKDDVPYRDSKLTYLMKDSIGGNSKTLMFVNVSPAASNSQESLTSLRYGNMVKQIKNEPKKNTETKEMELMKTRLRKLEGERANMISQLQAAHIDPMTSVPQSPMGAASSRR